MSLPVGSETAGLGSGTSQAVTSKQECTWTHFSNQINRNEKKKVKYTWKIKYNSNYFSRLVRERDDGNDNENVTKQKFQ